MAINLKIVSATPGTFEHDKAHVAFIAGKIQNRLQHADMAAAWIEIGGQLSGVKEDLTKEHKTDKTRLGWYKSFEDRLWPISRSTAEHLILISRFFVGSSGTYKNLPASWISLYAITIDFKDAPADMLAACLKDGRLHHLSTRSDVRQLAIALGLRKPPKAKAPNSQAVRVPLKTAPKQDRLEAVWEIMAKLGLKFSDLEKA
jgi:hypothetical protein